MSVSKNRIAAAVVTAGCVLAALGSGAPASANPADPGTPADPSAPTAVDTRFVEAFNGLGIQTAPGQDIPALGRQVCDMLATGLKGQLNPVPAVRGTVGTLEANGLTKPQAVGLMRMSVAAYCPQYGRYIGR